ncbi:Heat shock protein hslJ [Klebsiella pneumoniae]|uniref:Heat shock protein hslJ n=1 Tax=Klebsiella pneumoniae TaxID=573 RepID=A0A2X3F2Z4_KLEPN|nr:Heat shock protein hslJ [Klebsiella pneumoniae]
MNKFAALLAAGMLLSGCVYNSKVSTGAEQLQHHRFVLTSVNGQAVNASDRPLELSFGEKMAITGKMYVSGNMCNGFSGEGKVSDGELKVKSLAMTRMLCHDAQLNTLDATNRQDAARGCAGRSDGKPVDAGDRRPDAGL